MVWHEKCNICSVHVHGFSMCSGSWCAHSTRSPLLVKVYFNFWMSFVCQNCEDNIIIPVHRVHIFLPHFFLPLNFLGICYVDNQHISQLRLWLFFLAENVNDCPLDICQVSFLPHEYVPSSPRPRDNCNICRCFKLSIRLDCDIMSFKFFTSSQNEHSW